MAIWAFNEPDSTHRPFVINSLKEGISRFGWSYIDSADLRILEPKPWAEMTKDEITIWKQSHFLLNIKKDDWVVHINVPSWGLCTAGKVVEEYNFEEEDTEVSDFRHFLKLDKSSIIQFDRNGKTVHPEISRKLKLRGRYWRVYSEKEFFETISNVSTNSVSIKDGDTIGTHYLKKEITPLLIKITERIQKTHPEKKLEYFLADIFRNIPNVTDVKVNGSGWGTDFGADIIVKYQSGLSILNLQKEETLVVQVKSFQGVHWETNAVNQIKTAIDKYQANTGLIITTAQSSENLEKAVEELSTELDKPISLMAGDNVAKFVLKYEKGILIDI